MISLTSYDNVRAQAEAWTGTFAAVHINLRSDARFGAPHGYIAISAENARTLAHQLLVAAEALSDSVSQPAAA